MGYVIAPRLNAAGRLAHAERSLRLLLASSPEEARALALELEAANRERQRLTDAALERAREAVLAAPLPPLLLVAHEEFAPGVVGLVAGRLVEEFYRPAVVCALDAAEARGSARSIPEFNIIAALRRCGHLFLRFGGHPQAAGFLMERGRLEELRRLLVAEAARELAGVDLRPALTLDAEVGLGRVAVGELVALRELEPYGMGNPRPVLLARRLRLLEARQAGTNGAHLRLKLQASPDGGRANGGAVWHAIAFRQGDRLPTGELLDVAFSVAVDRWGGHDVLGLRVLDFRPSA